MWHDAITIWIRSRSVKTLNATCLAKQVFSNMSIECVTRKIIFPLNKKWKRRSFIFTSNGCVRGRVANRSLILKIWLMTEVKIHRIKKKSTFNNPFYLRQEAMSSLVFVCLSVARISQNIISKYCTDWHERLWKGWPQTKDQSIKFWLNIGWIFHKTLHVSFSL